MLGRCHAGGIDQFARAVEGVAGAQHRADLLFAARTVARLVAKRAEAAFAGQGQRGAPLGAQPGADFLAHLRSDPGRTQRLADPVLAKPAAQQAAAFRAGIGGIIDIARADQPFDQCSGFRLALAFPAALAQLAPQIIFKLGRAGRKPGDIGQRQLLQPGRIERPRRARGALYGAFGAGLTAHWPYLCHSVPQLGKPRS